ncbi:MAG: DNA ligase D [Alphaproteobacteria bacterium]|nr:DNA ligase D [Alphaproteobacteria bacterium]
MAGSTDDPLTIYRAKRDFARTPEPSGSGEKRRGGPPVFVVQEHRARRLHYDLRLELDGVLKSWAVTRAPDLPPAGKRLAIRTEDHPLSYARFEGEIPEGYGAGEVRIWDHGTWTPTSDAAKGLSDGHLGFRLDGQRLTGRFALVRIETDKRGKESWLLVRPRKDTNRAAGPPAFVPPQLASLAETPPEGADWVHEIKFDGYRIQAQLGGEAPRLFTRSGRDWTDRYPSIVNALAEVRAESALIDGELVALDPGGQTRFDYLQSQDDAAELVYYAFDLLFLDGEDLRTRSLRDRKAALLRILPRNARRLRLSEDHAGPGGAVLAAACRMGLEGIVSKRASAPYRSGRGEDWRKSKCVGRDEFVIVGYRRSTVPGKAFASLLLAARKGGALAYCGRVGTGFDEREAERLAERMARLVRTQPALPVPADARREAVWLSPRLVAEIGYTEYTADGRLRHPRFLGLREDKPAEEVDMPPARPGLPEGPSAPGAQTVAGVRPTHPDRLLYPGQGLTKRQLAEYYLARADDILPHLAGRPLSLVRCPRGEGEPCFFQKHHTASTPDSLDSLAITEGSGTKASYLVIRTLEGLVATAQMGALELHVWGARRDRIEAPERIVFDLDPAPDLPFTEVKFAAVELRAVLETLDLVSFPLLTGGKGIHVVVPIARRSGWPEVKAFARGLARRLAAVAPERYLATASKAERAGRIFIDWMRNERGATAICPFSPRARPGAPVATPVSWSELPELDSASAFTILTLRQRLSRLRRDPWADYFSTRQYLTTSRIAAVTKARP